MLDRRREPADIVASQDAVVGRLRTVGERWIVGLHEDDPLLRDVAEHVGRLADARGEHDAVGPVLEERPQRAFLAVGVMQPGHHEHGVPATGGCLLEPGRDLAVDRVCEVVEQQAQDVGPLGSEAPSRGVGDVAELVRCGAHSSPRPLTDPRVVLQRSRRGRFRRLREAGHIGEADSAFRRSTHGSTSPDARGSRQEVRPPRDAPRTDLDTHPTARCPSAWQALHPVACAIGCADASIPMLEGQRNASPGGWAVAVTGRSGRRGAP